jgi:hypothetical protein
MTDMFGSNGAESVSLLYLGLPVYETARSTFFYQALNVRCNLRMLNSPRRENCVSMKCHRCHFKINEPDHTTHG